MTNLVTDPATFAEESLRGFVAANRRYVRPVDGGVIRSTESPAGRVALVVGGGSGHYPAFAGYVGAGLAAGAVCGNIFASPSSGQVFRVARAVESGGGVLFVFGNYAGDVLQFGLAEERLRGEGMDARTVLVTDDIASASPSETRLRRGIAGDVPVMKIAGAAAEAGLGLDEVERLARKANDRTRTLGIAFSGCTLPGASEPLFTVAEGRVEIGLGIHGEPGLGHEPIGTAAELADLLVTRLLEERFASASRVVPIVNGLGATKYEELFTIFAAVTARLEGEGLTVVDPRCGELVTSLDMAGVSLTLLWLDAELEALWCAPANAPAFHTIPVAGRQHGTGTGSEAAEAAAATPHRRAVSRATPAEAEATALARDLLSAAQAVLIEHEAELGRMDAIAGDGDHGLGMARGVTGALHAADVVVANGRTLAELLAEAGEAWSESGGGTSGALWGMMLTAAATSVARDGFGDASSVSAAVDAALAGIERLGGARVGDKTMVDAFVPFARTLRSELDGSAGIAGAWRAAAAEATRAAEATTELTPRLGRARPHAARSIGHPDAGATSFALIVRAIGDRLGEPSMAREVRS